MEIKEIEGNLLDSDVDIIAHQVNCRCAMNSGVAKAIRNKWPIVYESYNKAFEILKESETDGSYFLGKIQIVSINDKLEVANLFAQNAFGYDGKRYTSYDALDCSLRKLAVYCEENNKKSIAIPYHMSCDRGGADWNVVVELIKSAFKDTDVTIEFWKLKN